FYQRAIAARRQLEPLNRGYFHSVVIDDPRGVYAYERNVGDDAAYVVINRSDRERQIKLAVHQPRQYVNWLDPSQAELVERNDQRPTLKAKQSSAVVDGTLSITLKPFGSAILHP